MAQTIAIVGPSGSGKSSSGETLDEKATYWINVASKPLPFRGWKKRFSKENKNYATMMDNQLILKRIIEISEKAPHIKTIVVDD